MSKPETSAIRPLAEVSAGPEVGGLTIAQLAHLHRHPEHPMCQKVMQKCNGRPNPANRDTRLPCPYNEESETMAYFSELTACDKCVQAALKSDAHDKAKVYWKSICPDSYLNTAKDYAGDPEHAPPIPAFPIGIFNTLADYKGKESLFLYGPSGSAKTRCAMLLMKRCLLANLHVGCLWPEELKHAAHSFQDRLKFLKSYARYDLLLMDDALLTGAQDEKMASFLTDLVDLMMRNKNNFIITSQIGGADYKEQAQKSDKTTRVDLDRIDALLRRIQQSCRVVPFLTATAPAGSTDLTF